MARPVKVLSGGVKLIIELAMWEPNKFGDEFLPPGSLCGTDVACKDFLGMFQQASPLAPPIRNDWLHFLPIATPCFG